MTRTAATEGSAAPGSSDGKRHAKGNAWQWEGIATGMTPAA